MPLTELAHALAPLGTATILLVAGIYFLSALFSGLSGFGFSAIGALTLCVLSPQFGICMLMLLSLFTQAMSIGSLGGDVRKHNVDWTRSFLPYAAGGVLGLPAGLWVLARASAHLLVMTLGALLTAYALYSIFKPKSLALVGADTSLGEAVAIGAMGGFIGGFSAFPGSALVVWNGLRKVSKERGRALTQPFILVMQCAALAIVAIARPSIFDAKLLALLLATLPLAWAGNWLGIEIYKRTSDINYRLITLVALGVARLSLVLKAALFA